MRTLWLVACLLAVVALATAFGPAAMSDLGGPEGLELAELHDDRAPARVALVDLHVTRPGSSTMTPYYVTHQVGPIDLRAGDRVLLTAREEVTTNSSTSAITYPTEHLGLITMLGRGIRVTAPGVDPANGCCWARNQIASNFDFWTQHHETVEMAEWYTAPRACSCLFSTILYFSTHPSWRNAVDTVRIEQGTYGRLQAAVFR